MLVVSTHQTTSFSSLLSLLLKYKFSSINHFTMCPMRMTIAFFKRISPRGEEKTTTQRTTKENSCVHVVDFSVLCLMSPLPSYYRDIISISIYIYFLIFCVSLLFCFLFMRFLFWQNVEQIKYSLSQLPSISQNFSSPQMRRWWWSIQAVSGGYENWPQ